ncbi:MAG TPA: methyltransferase domain-containing protein [Bdellovibrionota bacterium]|nr:methyltransferase domain-containing protein [Bdellovibrionota bacterium]
MSHLDDHFKAYGKDFIHALDNDLILKWYPQRIASLKKGSSLLELGIGHGFSTAIFANHFERHVVVDGSPKIIEAFKLANPATRVEVVEAYFESFETDERFDHVVMGFVLEHVDDPKLILDRFKKFLRPGGSIFATVPNAEALNKRLGLEAGIISDLFALGPGDRQLGHKQLFSVPRIRELARSVGLKEKHIEGLFLKPLTTKQLLDLGLDEKILQAMMKVGVGYPELSVGILVELAVS